MPSLYEVGRKVLFFAPDHVWREGTVEKKEYSWKIGWLYLIRLDELTQAANIPERDIWDYAH